MTEESEISFDEKILEKNENVDAPKWHDLLKCNPDLMNAEKEMIRRFGKPLMNEKQRQAKRKKHKKPYQIHRKTCITKSKEEWPALRVAGQGGGLYMSLMEEVNGELFFRLHFNDDYERQQDQYKARALTMDPHIVAQLLQVNHFHVDTLLTMSEMMMRSSQTAEGIDYVERALFRVECAFHGRFDMSTGKCRLPFSIVENQMVFVALKKHIKNIGRRGCWKSALECGKFLLSLDPQTDPMFSLLTLDYWCIQAEDYEFLINFSSDFIFQNCCLRLYPNFAYSVALAKRKLLPEAETVSEEDLMCDIGDCRPLSPSMCLQQAVLLFPELVGPLVHKCKPELTQNEDWKNLFNHEYFLEAKLRRQDNSVLRKLVEVYVERCHDLWKDFSTLHWLLKNAQKALKCLENEENAYMFDAIRVSVYDSALPSRFKMLDVQEFSDTIQLLPADDRPMINLPVEDQRHNAFEGQHPAQAFFTSLLPWNLTTDIPYHPSEFQDDFDDI